MVTINSFNTLCICIQILIYLNDNFIVCHLLWQGGDTTTFVTIVKKNICLVQKIKCFPGEMVQMVD